MAANRCSILSRVPAVKHLLPIDWVVGSRALLLLFPSGHSFPSSDLGKEPVFKCHLWTMALLKRALPSVRFPPGAHGVPDGIGDHELAVPPGKLPAFVVSASEGGIIEALEILEAETVSAFTGTGDGGGILEFPLRLPGTDTS